MPVLFWSQSRWQIMEIDIDLGYRHLETGITSKLE